MVFPQKIYDTVPSCGQHAASSNSNLNKWHNPLSNQHISEEIAAGLILFTNVIVYRTLRISSKYSAHCDLWP